MASSLRLCQASLLLVCITVSASIPARYDQRQDGKYNVMIHLKQFKLISLGSLNAGSSQSSEYDEGNYDYEDPTDPPEKPNTTTTATTEAAAATTTTTTSTNTTESALTTSNATLDNETSTNNITKRASQSLLTNVTKQNLILQDNVISQSALTAKPFRYSSTLIKNVTADVNCSPLNNSTADCPKRTAMLPITQSASNGGRPSRIQPGQVTRTKPTTTARTPITPYRPYDIITTTRRAVVHQNAMKKARCRPGFFRDRAGRCRRRLQNKTEPTQLNN